MQIFLTGYLNISIQKILTTMIMEDETDNTIEEENYKNLKLGNYNDKI